MFSLIDSEGRVYPCCHLYRDNHGNDERTREYRNKHCLVNVTESSFAEIWNDRKYQEKREILESVKPSSLDYAPAENAPVIFSIT
ncbi:MAG TPA: hypothetical protein DCQ37_02220 [Desulfobacteraceae bacterium]|nr:hypothetical protein [Desulfobacteraceae bacterium]